MAIALVARAQWHPRVSPLTTIAMWLRDFCGTLIVQVQTAVESATGDPPFALDVAGAPHLWINVRQAEAAYVPHVPNRYEVFILSNRKILADQMEFLLQGFRRARLCS